MTHSVYEPFAVLLGDEFRDHSIRAYMKARNGLCDTVGRLFCRSHGHELANDRRARAATVLRAAVALAKAEGIGQHELDELARDTWAVEAGKTAFARVSFTLLGYGYATNVNVALSELVQIEFEQKALQQSEVAE